MRTAATAGLGAVAALGVYLRWIRPRAFSWGAARDEASRPLWQLEPDGAGCTRLITRLRSRYTWTRPAIVTELILMEIGDPFMMHKCLLGIKQRAEQLAAGRRLQR